MSHITQLMNVKNEESAILCLQMFSPVFFALHYVTTSYTMLSASEPPSKKLIYNNTVNNTPPSFPITFAFQQGMLLETGVMNNFSDLRSSSPKQSSQLDSLLATNTYTHY